MTIEEQLKRILHSELFVEADPEEMGVDDSLRAVLGVDSLGFAELRVQCEDVFGIRITDDDFSPEHFRSVRTLAALVRQLRGAEA